MQELSRLTSQYGLLLVCLGVLLESLGLPIPSMLLLIVAGALAATDVVSAPWLIVSAVLACLAGEAVWYAAGRRYGHGVLKTLCRISISPDSCVRQTETFYGRWGAATLLFARFVPGLSLIAPPLAGAMRLAWRPFLLYGAAGAAAWVLVSVGIGAALHTRIERAGAYLVELGMLALYVVAGLLLLFLGFKWWERRRFFKELRMARISVAELRRLVLEGANPVILDVRSEAARKIDARSIPGALFVDVDAADHQLTHLSPDTEVVVYCTCPSEASAARVARLLMDRGFRRVRPLAGGLDAWLVAGHLVEDRAR